MSTMTDTVKKFLGEHLKTLLFFALAGLIGGFFTGIYALDSYPEEIRRQIYDQGLNEVLLGLVTALQSAGYGIILGTLGIILAQKIGLYKNEKRLDKKPLIYTAIVALVGWLSMILFDAFWFGRFSEAIMSSYLTKPTVPFILASLIYGGVIEEVMLRLFLLSLVAFILFKLFCKGMDEVPNWVFIVSNVICALLFAAGHLPATATMLGITPMIIFRCFLLNGGIGFMFGWLYHRFGLRYSMLAHAGCHLVSKLIWILFI